MQNAILIAVRRELSVRLETPLSSSRCLLQCLKAGQAAGGAEVTDMEPNTVLINFYKENAEFKWHRCDSRLSPRAAFCLCGGCKKVGCAMRDVASTGKW